MDIQLVPATQEDKAYLLTLRKLTMHEHLQQAGLNLSDKEHGLRVREAYDCSHIIVCSGKPVGMLKFLESTDVIEVKQLQIHPDHQGQGMGRRVMDLVLSWSVSRSKNVQLTVLKANPAKRLYERLGFKIVGQDKYEFHMEFSY